MRKYYWFIPPLVGMATFVTMREWNRGDRAWGVIGRSSEGRIDAVTLDSASYLKRREPYLAQALLETKACDIIDDSWNEVPLQERRWLLERADQAWKKKQASPVENRVHERWRKRVTGAWVITP